MLSVHGAKPAPVLSSSPPECCPAQATEKFWRTSNNVYGINCLVCGADRSGYDYIGHSGQPLECRIKSHASATRAGRNTSALSEHYKDDHPQLCSEPKFCVKILDKPLSLPHRQISEAVLIHRLDPPLNRRYESGKMQNVELFIDKTEAERRRLQTQITLERKARAAAQAES